MKAMEIPPIYHDLDPEISLDCSVCYENIPAGISQFHWDLYVYCPMCVSLWAELPEGPMEVYWVHSFLNALSQIMEHWEHDSVRERYQKWAAKNARRVGIEVTGSVEWPPYETDEIL